MSSFNGDKWTSSWWSLLSPGRHSQCVTWIILWTCLILCEFIYMFMIDQVPTSYVGKVGYNKIHAYAFDSNGMTSLHSTNSWRHISTILLKGIFRTAAEKFVRDNLAWEDWIAPEKELSSHWYKNLSIPSASRSSYKWMGSITSAWEV